MTLESSEALTLPPVASSISSAMLGGQVPRLRMPEIVPLLRPMIPPKLSSVWPVSSSHAPKAPGKGRRLLARI